MSNWLPFPAEPEIVDVNPDAARVVKTTCGQYLFTDNATLFAVLNPKEFDCETDTDPSDLIANAFNRWIADEGFDEFKVVEEEFVSFAAVSEAWKRNSLVSIGRVNGQRIVLNQAYWAALYAPGAKISAKASAAGGAKGWTVRLELNGAFAFIQSIKDGAYIHKVGRGILLNEPLGGAR